MGTGITCISLALVPGCLTVLFVFIFRADDPVIYDGPYQGSCLAATALGVWIVIALGMGVLQARCVDPPDVHESGCGMILFVCTLPILANTAIVVLFCGGFLILNPVYHLVKQRLSPAQPS